MCNNLYKQNTKLQLNEQKDIGNKTNSTQYNTQVDFIYRPYIHNLLHSPFIPHKNMSEK